MDHLEHNLKILYHKTIELAGEEKYETAKTLGIHEVLKAHFLIADFFLAEGNGLGGVGPKNIDLLHSALYRPHVCFGRECKWTDKFDIAATLLYGLLMDHPFHDANKRTAFLSIIHLLRRMNITPAVTHLEFENFLVEIADNALTKRARFVEYKKNGPDPEIKFISWWLRKNTREIDRRQYRITFRELKRILNRFGFDLENPSGNYIDVIKITNTTTLFGKKNTKKRKIGKIGYPGATRQINKGDLKFLRELTGLTEANGYDSQVFFNEADSLNLLIAEYQEPLRRLADR